MNRAVFLDRDGTIVVEKRYLSNPDKVEWIDGALAGLKRLHSAGFLLFIVTNQSGIGRGFYMERDMHLVNQKIADVAAEAGVAFEKIYYAAEAPEMPSYGRKPSPRFLLDASRDYHASLARSYMIGDKLSDLQCGWNAGVCKSILVKTGYGQKLLQQKNIDLSRAEIAENLAAAADWILQQNTETPKFQ